MIAKPTFRESFQKCNSDIDYRMEIIEKLYNDNYLNYNGDRTERIPRIFHYVWLGCPFPPKLQELINIWKENHPSYEFKLWNEEALEKFGLENYDLYSRVPNPSAKSDVVRCEILYRYGGIYMDSDFLNIKPLDDLLYLNYFTAYGQAPIIIPHSLVSGFVGTCPNNGMVRNVIDKMKEVKNIPLSIGDIMDIGPVLNGKTIINEIDPDLTVFFSASFFFPFPGKDRMQIRNLSISNLRNIMKKFTYPETYAIHLHYCSWQGV
jgi:hypothetical protein